MRNVNARFRLTATLAMLVMLFAVAARAADEDKDKDKDKSKEAQATKIKKEDVPKKVMDAVKDRFPKAHVHNVARETEEGKVIYDFEMKVENQKVEADGAEDGTSLETEKEIAAKDALDAVTKAAREKYPRGNIKEVMAKTKGDEKTVHEYEVLVRDEAKNHELTISPEGKITEEAAAEDEANAKDADHDKDKDNDKDKDKDAGKAKEKE